MSNHIVICGYTITADPSFQDERVGVTPWLKEQMERLFLESSNKKNRKIIGELKDLIVQFPDTPQLKNYLTAAYFVRNKFEESSKVNLEILKAHPDYLFGKINLAYEYFGMRAFEKMTEALGEKMELKALYPDRKLFHFSEVTAYYKVAVLYFCAIHDLEAAEKRYEILKAVAHEDEDLEAVTKYIVAERLYAAREKYREEERSKTKVIQKKLSHRGQKTTPPDFVHPQLHWLYEENLNISHSKIRIITSLPRESLLKDLEAVLLDAVQRYYFFRKKEAFDGWDDDCKKFPVHALFLLGELRATESLPVVFEFFSQHEEVLDFWFSDYLTEINWEPFYYLLEKDISLARDFLLKPGVYTYAKTEVVTAIAQVVLHNPERKAEATEFFNSLFHEFAKTGIRSNVIDSDFIAYAIGDAAEAIDPLLLPAIKPLFEIGYVSTGSYKSYDALVKNCHNPDRFSPLKPLLNIYDRYDEIKNSWNEYLEGDDEIRFAFKSQQPFIAPPKAGRNDPCPCGSGKKYKKCCLDKLNE